MIEINGPGKYDALCTAAREGAKAEGAVLILFGGDKGDGFSVQGPLSLLFFLPQHLRNVADQIEKQHGTA